MSFLDSIGNSWLADPLGGVISYASAKEANRENVAQAREQRDWTKMMSDTQYQRAVKDMEAAGINPMMASQLGGASSGSGATATVSDAGNTAISTAQQSRRLRSDLKLLEAQTYAAKTAGANSDAQAAKNITDAGVSATTNQLLKLQLPQATNEAVFAASDAGRAATAVNRIMDTLGNTGKVAGGVKALFDKSGRTSNFYNNNFSR